MSASRSGAAGKRARPAEGGGNDAAERAVLLTKLLRYQAGRQPSAGPEAAAPTVDPAEAACEAQLRDSLTAAILRLPPSKVVSKGALAAFKQQHVAMFRVVSAAQASLAPPKQEPAAGEAAALEVADGTKPPVPQSEALAPVKSEG